MADISVTATETMTNKEGTFLLEYDPVTIWVLLLGPKTIPKPEEEPK